MPHVHGHSHHSHHGHHDDNDGLAKCLAALCLCCVACCKIAEDESEALLDESVLVPMMMTNNIIDTYQTELQKSLIEKRTKVDANIKALEETLSKYASILSKIHRAIFDFIEKSKDVKNKINGWNDEASLLESLDESLRCTIEILKTPSDTQKIQQYSAVAEYAIGKQSVMRQVFGAFLFFGRCRFSRTEYC